MSSEFMIFIKTHERGLPVVTMFITQSTLASEIYQRIVQSTGRQVDQLILMPPTPDSYQILEKGSTLPLGKNLVDRLRNGDSALIYRLQPITLQSNNQFAISTIRQQLQNLKLQRDGLTASITALEQSLHELEQ